MVLILWAVVQTILNLASIQPRTSRVKFARSKSSANLADAGNGEPRAAAARVPLQRPAQVLREVRDLGVGLAEGRRGGPAEGVRPRLGHGGLVPMFFLTLSFCLLW